MADLIPVWDTPAGALATVIEGQTVSLPLALHEEVRVAGRATQFVVSVGLDAISRVIGLTIAGAATPFTVNAAEGTVLWDVPLTGPQEIVVTLRAGVSFALLNGEFPPGLGIDLGTGLISGTIGHITETAAYEITLRATNTSHVRDRYFVILAKPKLEPASFYVPYLLPYGTDPQLPQPYKDLGAVLLGGTFAYTMDITIPDGLPPLEIVPVLGLPGLHFAGLPDGLALSDTTISGLINVEACPGKYVFQVRIDDPVKPSFMTFQITVVDAYSPTFDVPPQIVWDTPEGDLGDIYETDPCYFAVSAHALGTRNNITYAIKHDTNPLPDGVHIDPSTGRLMGVFPHVPFNTRVTFTVRASVGMVFLDRTFSIRVLNRWTTADILTMQLRFRVTERKSLFPTYASLIPDTLVFRPDDANFGRPAAASTYLIKGLDGAADLDAAILGADREAGRINHTYNTPFRLILGTHRYAVARDSRGAVVYEVLMRDLYDPSARAGGFLNQDLVLDETVAYPQNHNLKVYAHSLNNIRRDLTLEVGFPVPDADLRHTIGLDGPELMPLWMRSAQTAGNASTAPGYLATVPIAYLTPGSTPKVTALLRKNKTLLPESGIVYYFDKYLVTENGADRFAYLRNV
jgi:hypothetical protein